jgi:hypothetical protein
MNEQLASVKCRVAVLRGEHSVVVPPDTAAYMYELMGRVSPVVTIPEAHHHLVLDQPVVRHRANAWQIGITGAVQRSSYATATRPACKTFASHPLPRSDGDSTRLAITAAGRASGWCSSRR